MSRLSVSSLVVGTCMTNCYIAADADTNEALIVDPGESPEEIDCIVRNRDFRVMGIVNTHCHGDHIIANARLKERYNCRLMIHELDAPGLLDADINLSGLLGYSMPLSPPADILLQDGDAVSVGGIQFKVIHTPGHTPGCICLYVSGILLSGDTLFAGSVGRVDLPGGSMDDMIASIKSKLLTLPDETEVFPGHGPSTTIGDERTSNPWLR